MSPSMSNFFHEFAAAAQAMERLPVLENELQDAKNTINSQAATIQRLELKLMERSNDIDNLRDEVRKAEGRADEAESMFLECDDKLSAFRRLFESFGRDASALIAAQQPAPVIPEAVAVQGEEQVQGVSEGNAGMSTASSMDAGPAVDDGLTKSEPVYGHDWGKPTTFLEAPIPFDEQGQSEPLPPAPSTEAQSAPTAPSNTEAPATALTPQTSGAIDANRYRGKLYVNIPGYISRGEWLEGGGTHETYDWRHGWTLPEGIANAAA